MAPTSTSSSSSKSTKSQVSLVSDLIRGVLYTITGLLARLTATVSKTLDLVSTTIYAVKKTAIITTAIVIVLVVILGTAVSTYMIFYFAYVPILSAYTDINLDFGVQCKLGNGVCGYQSANLTVQPEEGHLLQYFFPLNILQTFGGGLGISKFPTLDRGQAYKMSVLLDVPEDATNIEAGEFNLVAQTYGLFGSEIRTATAQLELARPGYLKSLMRLSLYIPRWFFGWHIRIQNMEVDLFSSYLEDNRMSTMGMYIEIQDNAVNINSAYLRVRTLFSGIKYALYQYPVTTAVIGIGFVFCFLLIVSLTIAYAIFFVLLPVYSNLNSNNSKSSPSHVYRNGSIPSNRVRVEMLSAGATGATTQKMMEMEDLYPMDSNSMSHINLRQRPTQHSSDC